MTKKKKILAICGSTRKESANLQLLKKISNITSDIYEVSIFEGIAELPHFNPDLDNENPPKEISDFRENISNSDGVIICTPEYVFSIPGSLKNAIEWCVSTNIFSNKPIGIITASASGDKGHEELQLIMRTLECKFDAKTAIQVKAIKGKIHKSEGITDTDTLGKIEAFLKSFDEQLKSDI